MLKPDLAILEDLLRVQLVTRKSASGQLVSGRCQKALLLAIWATEGSPIDLPALALASGLEREHTCYAAQVLVDIGLVTRARAPHADGRGGGVPRVYAIMRGRLARFRGEWPRGRWPRPGLEGFGAAPAGTWRRAVEIRDEEARLAGIAVDGLGRAVSGPVARCRERIVRRLHDEGVGAWLSLRQIGQLLGVQRKSASALVRRTRADRSRAAAAAKVEVAA